MQLILLMGIPGSGKSTFYKERFFDTHVRINLDMLRTRHREQLLIEACLKSKQPMCIDNTNPTAAERARYILPAKKEGFAVIAYYIAVKIEIALTRNEQRPESTRVPAVGVRAVRNRLELPSLSEGIDERYYVRMGDAHSFVVENFQDDV